MFSTFPDTTTFNPRVKTQNDRDLSKQTSKTGLKVIPSKQKKQKKKKKDQNKQNLDNG